MPGRRCVIGIGIDVPTVESVSCLLEDQHR
jgi:hypothetical protein